jgi:hypothetical protein
MDNNMQENNLDDLLENNDVPDLQLSDEVPGATGYYWDPETKVWVPVFKE